MQFATLFLIASAVLALPTGASESHAVAAQQQKRANFYFPDDDRLDDRKKEGQRLDKLKYPFKDSTDPNGNPCTDYSQSRTIEAVPQSCLRAVFCDGTRGAYREFCDKPRNPFHGEYIDKEKLIAATTADCAFEYICREQDKYNFD